MGIFDQLQSVLGGEGGNLIDQVKQMATEKGLESLTEKFPQIGEMLHGVDSSSLQDLFSQITANGIPDSLDEIKEIIAKFTQK